MTKLNLFVSEVKKKLEEAINRYELSFKVDDVLIKFELKGLSAATAESRETDDGIIQILDFNMSNIENDYDEMFNVIIPHEIAHLVCHEKTELGYKHDSGWKDVCKALGGTGERTHNMNAKRVRGKKIYVYQIQEARFTVSSLHHKKIQEDNEFFHVMYEGQQKSIIPRHYTGDFLLVK